MSGPERDYSVYLIKLDGSSLPVLLGSGTAGDISPDEKWVTAILPSDLTKVAMLPTGIGQMKTNGDQAFRYQSASWSSDGKKLIVQASRSGAPLRFWVQDIGGGAPVPVTPEGVGDRLVRLGHSDWVSARKDGATLLYPIDGGAPITAVGISETDFVVSGSEESDVIYVSPASTAIQRSLWRVNIRTGKRSPFVTIGPIDPVGIVGCCIPILSADQKWYIFEQIRSLSVLYVASGLK
jgi:hypothetical protein